MEYQQIELMLPKTCAYLRHKSEKYHLPFSVRGLDDILFELVSKVDALEDRVRTLEDDTRPKI